MLGGWMWWITGSQNLTVALVAESPFVGTGYAISFSGDSKRILVVSNVHAAVSEASSGLVEWQRSGIFAPIAAWSPADGLFLFATIGTDEHTIHIWQWDRVETMSHADAYALTTDAEFATNRYFVLTGGTTSVEFGESGAAQLWYVDKESGQIRLCSKLGLHDSFASFSVDISEQAENALVAVSFTGSAWEMWKCRLEEEAQCECDLLALLPETKQGQVAMSSDGRVVAALTADQFSMYIVNGDAIERKSTMAVSLPSETPFFHAIDFSPTDPIVAVALGNRVELRYVPEGRLLHTIRDGGRAIRFSPDGRLMAVTRRDVVAVYHVQFRSSEESPRQPD